MANRYYSNTNGKLSAPKPPSQKGGVGSPGWQKGKTHAWTTNIGPVGPSRNKQAKFHEVHAYPAQHLADDFSAQGAIGGASSGASMGSYFGPWGAVIGGVAGGLLGGFTGGKGGQQQGGGGGGLPGLPF